MAMRILTVAVAAMLATAGAVSAAPISPDAYKMQTFSDVVVVCGAEDEDTAQFCRGWLMGNGSLYAALLNAKAIEPWACADPIPSLDEIRRAIVAYGETNPQMGGQTAIDGFWSAAAAIWPCDK